MLHLASTALQDLSLPRPLSTLQLLEGQTVGTELWGMQAPSLLAFREDTMESE